jgi:hypothetical protein
MTINHAKKGVKGFQTIPENLQKKSVYNYRMTKAKKSVYNYRMTKAESEAINNFCKENEITKAEMFRSALNTFYLANHIEITETESHNPNQLRIE